jgi:hypothetical protein
VNTNPFAGANAIQTYPKQKAWSFSVVGKHAKCPQVIRFTKIDRLPEPSNAAMDRGTQMHKAAAALIEHDVDQGLLSPQWAARVKELRQRHARSETQLAFDVNWVPTEWYAPNVWGRVIIDANYIISPGIVQIVEFKTGKQYPDHAAQLRLYALAGFILYPDAEQVRAENWYFDGPPSPMPGYVAQRSAVPRLKEEFIAFSAPLLNDELYPARPGPHCRWCNFRRSNSGPCEHG